MPGLVFDTGALVALQDRARFRDLLRRASERTEVFLAPTVVVTEFLAGFHERDVAGGEFILRAFESVPVQIGAARRAAQLLRAVRRSWPSATPSVVDALVAAVGEGYGAIVIRGDRADFEALRGASRGFALLDLDEV